MPQISLYIDSTTLQKIVAAARAKNQSVSKWVAEQLRTKVDPVYPHGFDQLFGSIRDENFVEPSELKLSDDSDRVDF
jgi:hypothetical protein